MPCWRAALIYGHYAVGINKAAVLLLTQLVPKINVLLSITFVLSPSSATMAKLRVCNWISLGERRHVQGSACPGMQFPRTALTRGCTSLLQNKTLKSWKCCWNSLSRQVQLQETLIYLALLHNFPSLAAQCYSFFFLWPGNRTKATQTRCTSVSRGEEIWGCCDTGQWPETFFNAYINHST